MTPPLRPHAHTGYSGRTLIATRGLPASGKTTWAQHQLALYPPGIMARCNRDDLRRMTQGTPRYDPVSESVITEIQHAVLTILLRAAQYVIVDDTNLNDDRVYELAVIAHQAGAAFEEQDFRHVPLAVCLDRDRRRTTGRVGEDVIRAMYDRYLLAARDLS
jgi:tRNA uridine 5-carbamoylmethylation protein Kti12